MYNRASYFQTIYTLTQVLHQFVSENIVLISSKGLFVRGSYIN